MDLGPAYPPDYAGRFAPSPTGPLHFGSLVTALVGYQEARLAGACGGAEFVVRRSDGPFAYQLAVVVDDAEQGITHVVRGADLLDSTPQQIWLQKKLGLPHPKYLHIPVVTNAAGQKLSKQTHAPALRRENRERDLEAARQYLLDHHSAFIHTHPAGEA